MWKKKQTATKKAPGMEKTVRVDTVAKILTSTFSCLIVMLTITIPFALFNSGQGLVYKSAEIMTGSKNMIVQFQNC